MNAEEFVFDHPLTLAERHKLLDYGVAKWGPDVDLISGVEAGHYVLAVPAPLDGLTRDAAGDTPGAQREP